MLSDAIVEVCSEDVVGAANYGEETLAGDDDPYLKEVVLVESGAADDDEETSADDDVEGWLKEVGIFRRFWKVRWCW